MNIGSKQMGTPSLTDRLVMRADVAAREGRLGDEGDMRDAAAELTRLHADNKHLENVVAARDKQLTDESAAVADLYRAFAGHPKTGANPHWQAKLRQTLQRGAGRRIGRDQRVCA